MAKSPVLIALRECPNLVSVKDGGEARAERWRKLGQSQAARAEHRQFQVEGERAVELLLAAGVYPVEELVVVSEELARRQAATQERAAKILREAARQKVPVFDVSKELFRRIADVNKVRGVMAIARQGAWSLDELVEETARAGGLAIAAVGLTDPGNVGTLIRSAHAFGAGALFALEGAADPYQPKTIRASAGHLLRVVTGSWKDFAHACRTRRVRLVGLAFGGDKTVPLDHLDLEAGTPAAVCVGSEGHGYPASVKGFDIEVAIPMAAGSDSLNAAVSGSLLMWKLRRV